MRLIPFLGLIIGALIIISPGVRKGGLLPQGICAWLTTYTAHLIVAWIQWDRIQPVSRRPFYPEAIGAAVFATLAALIAIAAGALLSWMRMKSAPNQAFHATSESATSAASSAREG
jgi:hypothetical protein